MLQRTRNEAGLSTSGKQFKGLRRWGLLMSLLLTLPTAAWGVSPTVQLISPTNGATAVAPGVFTLTANASGSNPIVAVRFYSNGVQVAVDSTAPYSRSYSNLAAGTYVLTAEATDNVDQTGVSAPVTVTVTPAPTVKLTGANKLVDSTVALGSTASATFRLATAGKIRFQTSAGGLYEEQSPFDEWLEPESTTASLNFEVMAVPVSGAVTSGPTNQWLALGGVARDWTLTNVVAGTSAQAVLTIQIRRIGTTTVLASTNATLRATVLNNPPTVAWTAPAANSLFTANSNIPLSASAADSDGSISKVEFLSGSTVLSTDITAPYTYTWPNVPAGTYSLSARATDNMGAVAISSPPVPITVNAMPIVTMPTPTMQNSPCTWTLSATASDSDGTISQVQFFNGATSLGIDTTAPYTAAFSGVVAGSHNLTARAVDNRGAVTTSPPVTAVCNAMPTISITNPIAGLTQSTSLDLAAAAADSDGSIASVQYFEGATAINSTPVTTAPYTFPWSNVAQGSHTVTARAIDNRRCGYHVQRGNVHGGRRSAHCVAERACQRFELHASVRSHPDRERQHQYRHDQQGGVFRQWHKAR